jgi:galactokinase
MYQSLINQKFIEIFGNLPQLTIKAPGRINLIGEHTDYNNGLVLPAAIDKAIYFGISVSESNNCEIHSIDLNDSCHFTLDCIAKSDKSWANFIIGVISEIQNQGYKIPKGIKVVFGGDVPLGAGLSSSAAVESGIGFAINELFQLDISKLNLALIAQKAEHNFAGVNCGIMDMFASIFGKQNAVIKLDCKDLSYEYFPFHAPEYTLILCNTGVKHSLSDSEYNIRRIECETGVEILKKAFPNIESLRDASMEMLDNQKHNLLEIIYKRCKYIIEENIRVKIACDALQQNDLVTFGNKMYETHQGLRHEYEVSCPELDFLVDKTLEITSQTDTRDMVLGARMMGGGFGGCTINLVKTINLQLFKTAIQAAYFQQFKIEMATYEVKITNGVELI